MESMSPLVPFPQIKVWAAYKYRPCTIPYRFPSDPPQATPTELLWIQLFRKSIPSFRKRAEADDSVSNAAAKASKFAERYAEILDDLQANPLSHGGPPDAILLCKLRELCLREVGFTDIYRKVKDEENAKSLALLEGVVATADKIQDQGQRIEHLIKGVFAGNIFDLGSNELAERYETSGCSFQGSVDQLLPRPWIIDDLDKFKDKWLRKPWKKAVIFVDNAGADIILGILPFARELLRRGTKVWLMAPLDSLQKATPCMLLVDLQFFDPSLGEVSKQSSLFKLKIFWLECQSSDTIDINNLESSVNWFDIELGLTVHHFQDPSNLFTG